MEAAKKAARAKMAADRPSSLGMRKITVGESSLRTNRWARGAYAGEEDATQLPPHPPTERTHPQRAV